ncbi:ATP-binding protein [Treponema sp. R6D11]
MFSVSDDGKGLANGFETTSGLGLQTMRHRAMLLGGRIDFISEEGNGFMVCIEIPHNKEVK